jgi:hypothetical protein
LSGAISSRWDGPNEAKDVVRKKVWRRLGGKQVYIGTTSDYSPFVGADSEDIGIDVDKVQPDGVDYETGAAAHCFVTHRDPASFEDLPKPDHRAIDCIAFTPRAGRPGRLASFADLEPDIFRELRNVSRDARIATTVHPRQVVDDSQFVTEPRALALHLSATKRELRARQTLFEQPTHVASDETRPDKFMDIRFSRALRERLGGTTHL